MGQGNQKGDPKLPETNEGGAHGGAPDSDKHSMAKPITGKKPHAGGHTQHDVTHIAGSGGAGGSGGSGSGVGGMDMTRGDGGMAMGMGMGMGGMKDLDPMGMPIGTPAGSGGVPSSLTDRVARIISKEQQSGAQGGANTGPGGLQLTVGSVGSAGGIGTVPLGASPKMEDLLIPEPKQIETVSTLFKWSGGGNEVFLTGSFNGWQGKIRMQKTNPAAAAAASSSSSNADNRNSQAPASPSPNTSSNALVLADGAGSYRPPSALAAMGGGSGGAGAAAVVEFVLVIDIPPGVHQYKYIVDEQWRINPDAPTTTNAQGVVNNIIDVKRPVFEDNLSAFADSDDEELDENKQRINYGHRVPLPDEYQKDPPKIPPQLGNILLNAPVSPADPYLLPTPQHVTLNHMYVYGYGKNPGESEVLVTGITQRFKTKSFINNTPKFVTTVFYSPKPNAS